MDILLKISKQVGFHNFKLYLAPSQTGLSTLGAVHTYVKSRPLFQSNLKGKFTRFFVNDCVHISPSTSQSDFYQQLSYHLDPSFRQQVSSFKYETLLLVMYGELAQATKQ